MPSWDAVTSVAANSGDFYAGYSNFAKLCVETLGDYLSYISTPQTAADMNSVLESIGQPYLNYYGTSYGSVLGATYAQLFPDKVGKMALDGIANYEDYWSRLSPGFNVDIDAVWEGLLMHCLEERDSCALADGFTNVTELSAAIEHKLDAMDVDPIGVYINSTAYGILRGSDVRGEGVFPRLYSPSRWPYLARSLYYLLKGDYETPYLHLYGGVAPKNPRSRPISLADASNSGEDDAYTLISLADKSPKDQATRPKRTRKEIAASWEPLVGYMAQDVDVTNDFIAETWLVSRTHDLVPEPQIKTSNPVLLLSTKLDPVTPLRSAKALEKVLQDSVLLVQDSIGHSTLSKASRCTAGHVRRYFNEGVLPTAGTICAVDNPNKYFPNPDLAVSKVVAAGRGQGMTLEQALDKLSEHSDKLAQRHMKQY